MSDEITAFAELLRAAGPILREMRDADILRPPTFNIFRVLGRDTGKLALIPLSWHICSTLRAGIARATYFYACSWTHCGLMKR